MEGYFPIYDYVKLTGVSKDTAYHRANRGTIESFKGKDGRWFLYFSDNRGLPKGFVTIEDYAKKNKIGKAAVNYRLKAGYFSDDETKIHVIIDEDGHPIERRLIREDAIWINLSELKGIIAGGIMNSLRPKGTFTVSEYAGIIGKTNAAVYSKIRCGYIKFTKVEGHYFIYPDGKEVTA